MLTKQSGSVSRYMNKLFIWPQK